MCVRLLYALVLFAACIGPASSALAEEAAGTRFGVRFAIAGGEEATRYHQLEAVVTTALPWSGSWSGHWSWSTEIDFAAGTLRAGGKNGLVLSAGPALLLHRSGFPVSLRLGTGPAYISRDRYGDSDLGGSFHFVSHVGIRCQVTPDWHLAYRYQHMSNGGLQKNNPGVNLHVVEVGTRF